MITLLGWNSFPASFVLTPIPAHPSILKTQWPYRVSPLSRTPISLFMLIGRRRLSFSPFVLYASVNFTIAFYFFHLLLSYTKRAMYPIPPESLKPAHPTSTGFIRKMAVKCFLTYLFRDFSSLIQPFIPIFGPSTSISSRHNF